MPLPESLKINGLVYKIRTDNDAHLDDTERWGETLIPEQTISIDSKATISRQQCTVIHEAIHAIEDRNTKETRMSEEQVTSLAISLFQVFQDNPDLLDYLKRADDDPT